MDEQLNNALDNFKRCGAEAPEGCYEDAKALNAVIGEACVGVMRELRALGLRSNPCDLAFDLEAAIYNYAKRSNPNATVFTTAEGFGASLGGPARERVLNQAVRDRDFLRGHHRLTMGSTAESMAGFKAPTN